jgi:AcrR family transcriptional regulator
MARTGGERTRAKVLSSAVRLFGEQGYASTSLDEVAADVGLRKQSLLYYFPSKTDLFAAAAAEAAAAMYAAMDGALRENDPGGLDRLPVFVDAASRLANERPEVDSAAEWLERGMHEGVIRTQNARLALLTIYSAVMGHLTESSVQQAVLDDDARRVGSDELVAFLRAALAPDERHGKQRLSHVVRDHDRHGSPR